jgi:TetR/AcrR family tetracycline transcriptional repressor
MDEVGLDDLTMRRLADRLNVQAGALYRHLANKDQLLDEMADSLCADVLTPSPDLPWLDQLRSLSFEQRRVLQSRRDASRLIAGTIPTGPQRLRIIDFTLGTLLRAGFSGNEAFQIALLLSNFVTGSVLEEASAPAAAATARERGDAEMAAHTATWLSLIAGDQFRNIQRAAGELAEPTLFEPDANFAFGLDLLLAGIEGARPHAKVGASEPEVPG